MNINCHSESYLNCFDSLVLQSAVHMLRMFADDHFDIMRLFDIMGLEHKLFLDLWLYLLDNESPAPRPWVSLLFSQIPGIPYDQKLHFSILALPMNSVNLVQIMQILGFPNIQARNTHA